MSAEKMRTVVPYVSIVVGLLALAYAVFVLLSHSITGSVEALQVALLVAVGLSQLALGVVNLRARRNGPRR